MRVQSLDGEDLLEEEMATHCSILAWRIPWTEEPGGPQSPGSQRVRHGWRIGGSPEVKVTEQLRGPEPSLFSVCLAHFPQSWQACHWLENSGPTDHCLLSNPNALGGGGWVEAGNGGSSCRLLPSELRARVFIVWMENREAEMSAGKGKSDWRAILENSRQRTLHIPS